MEQFLLSPIPIDALRLEISTAVRNELAASKKQDLEERMLSPAETCKLFQPAISKVTLHNWTKEGRLRDYRIGGRVFYKYSEVISSLTTLKKYKRC